MDAFTLHERPWLKLYGDRPTSGTADFPDMLSLFRAVARTSLDSLFYSGHSMSYQWLDDRSDELAAWLAEDVKVNRGARIAIILQNVPEFVIATIAAWKLGCVPMPLNPMYQERELALLFADGLPCTVICHDTHVYAASAALQKANIASTVILTCPSNSNIASSKPPIESASNIEPTTYSLDYAMSRKRGISPPFVSVRATETGLLLYTSGTTGAPKGAILSHNALAFNSRASLDWFSVRRAGRLLATAPLFHIVGFLCQLCTALMSQGALILNYRFEAGAMLELIFAHRPSFMIGPITAYIAMMNHSSVRPDHFSSFDTLYAGGGPVPLAVVRQFEARFGRRIASAYGMTETCAPTHVVPYEQETPVDAESGTLSVGIPISGSDAIIEREDGKLAAAGEAGELLVRGPMLMDGYLNKPEATTEALTGGWMHTGDVAIMDPRGWFFLIDRKKDVIIASGFKVWPREIEDVLYMHPSVREAAVVGVPDSYRGETIRAYVSLKQDMQASAEELMILCRTQLAAYKAPRQVEFLTELPKTASGKIMRAELRKTAASISPSGHSNV